VDAFKSLSAADQQQISNKRQAAKMQRKDIADLKRAEKARVRGYTVETAKSLLLNTAMPRPPR